MFQLLKILSLVKTILGLVKSFYEWIVAFITKRRQNKEIEEIKKVETKIEEANKIEDEATRLKKKAEAACELEKVFDPNRKC